MQKLKDSIKALENCTNHTVIISLLQQVNRLLLMDYCVRIDDNCCLYPTEVEAYYNHPHKFIDACVHNNKLQKGRIGKIYLHRKGEGDGIKSIIKGNRGGLDVCLSNSEEYAYGVLIRSARINSENPICGPGRIFKHLTPSYDRDLFLNSIEKNACLEKTGHEDPREKTEVILAKREGITKGEYQQEFLRSFIEFQKNTKIKGKENIVGLYLEQTREDINEKRIMDLLGYRSKKLLDVFNISSKDIIRE